jgi:hypothetical protein
LLTFLLLIALLLFIALFIRKDYAIDQAITVSRTRAEVFDYVRYLKNQDYYSKWVMADPKMARNFTGNDGYVGFIYAWDSQDKDVGAGAQEITAITPGSRMDCEIRFVRPFVSKATTSYILDSLSPYETRIHWTFSGRAAYPTNLMRGFMMRMLRADINSSLKNLKAQVEQKPVQ